MRRFHVRGNASELRIRGNSSSPIGQLQARAVWLLEFTCGFS